LKIKNTKHEAEFPWPSGMLVQGGDSGLVVNRTTKASYTTAFVEAFPDGTFLRGEGPKIADAEKACWEKYLLYVYCVDKSRKHGPFESRGYENGSGFCTRCGLWFDADVANMPESEAHRQDRLDFNECTLEVLSEEKWPPNQFQLEVLRRMQHRTAVRQAERDGREPPEFEVREPKDEAQFEKDSNDAIERVLDSLAGKRRLGDPE
jgi:hypothetical protein